MTIFGLKKQIQKLTLILPIILIIFSIFPVLNKAEAQGPRGPSSGCDVTVPNFSSSTLQSSKSTASKDERFSVYFEGVIPESLASTCTDADKSGYSISIYTYDDDWGTTLASMVGAYNYQVSYPVEFFQENGRSGFRQKVNDLSFGFLYSGVTTRGGTIYAGPGGTNKMYAYWHKNGEAPTSSWWTTNYVPSGGLSLNYVTTSPNPDTATLPNIPGIAAGNTTVNNNTVLDYTKIQTVIKPNSSGNGLRTKYRVLWSDASMVFGTTAGLDGVHVEWGSTGISVPQQFKLPKKDDGTLWDFDPYFQGLSVYFNYFSAVSSLQTRACEATNTGTSCSNVAFLEAGGNGAGSPGKTSLPNDFSPTIYANAWKTKVQQPTSQQTSQGNNGQPLGSVEFAALPILFGSKTNLGNYVIPFRAMFVNDSVALVSGGGTLQKFTVEVYATDADIIAACKADGSVTDKTRCDNIAYAKYASGSTLTQTTNPSETQQQDAKQTLYSFILRVISSIVIFLTSIIYKIFAFFVVPVLNALLQVRPYQDAFVNIIYPGWLILRNLANIFFIIALLVVGLRILFQQSAASTARGFIVRLILMALLVNFSLVIAQGIVGIADTVQSQFLPGNTRVIEALGTKLMVEPIVSFRSAISGDGTTDITGTLNGDQTITDIAKPIVLLMLAVAAFFCFLAIGAFLAVRLVALMLLYMVSPIAYVGYVMDETRGYAKRWWNEFIKYAFLTPILVFFLNIAALVATTFSSVNGNVIRIEDTLAGDLVSGGLTIVSHFIVLLVIFAGMKFAMSSGTLGAKAIVNYAQKGFKNSLTKWPGTAKDWATDKVASKAEEKGYKGFAKAITAAAKPLAFGAALKKAKLDEPLKDRQKREASRLASLAGAKEKGSPLKKYWDGIKEKDLGNEDSASLQDMLVKGVGSHDGQKVGEAMLQMGKNGNFDEILAAAEKATGKTAGYYSKDAAGLNSAVKDLNKAAGISDDETKEFMKSFDNAAKKDKGKAHYSGNTYRDAEGKIKVFDVEEAEGGGQRFAGSDKENVPNQNKWVQKQIDRRLDMGLVDDLKQTSLDSMVAKTVDNAGNESYRLTDTQLGMFKKIDMGGFTDNAVDRFKSASPKKLEALRTAWQSTGRAELERQLLADGVNATDAATRVQTIDRLFTINNNTGQNANQQATPQNAPQNNPPRNQAGFTARPIVVQGGNVVNPGGGTAYSSQSSQMEAAQNINNAVRFQSGPAGGTIGDVSAINNNQQNRPPVVGYADSNIGREDNLNEDFVDKPKQRAGFTAETPKNRKAGFIQPKQSKKEIVPTPESKSSPTIKPAITNTEEAGKSDKESPKNDNSAPSNTEQKNKDQK